MNRNNFKDQACKSTARYKLWIKYRPEYVNALLPRIKVYYSHEKGNDPEYGCKKLMKMLNNRLEKVETAILYDNQTNKEIERY